MWPVNVRHFIWALMSTNFHCKNAVVLVRPFSKLIYVRNFGRCRADNLNQIEIVVAVYWSTLFISHSWRLFRRIRDCHIQLLLIRKYVTSFGISLFSVINVVVLSSMFIGFYFCLLLHHVLHSIFFLFLISFQTWFWSNANVSYRWILIISLGCDCLVAVNSLSIFFSFFLILFIYFCFDFFFLFHFSFRYVINSYTDETNEQKKNSNTTDETKFIGWNQNGYKCVLGDKLLFFLCMCVHVTRILFWTTQPSQKQYELTLVASDSLNENHTKIIITVRDVNDLPPVFPEKLYCKVMDEEISAPFPMIQVSRQMACFSSFPPFSIYFVFSFLFFSIDFFLLLLF